jgi:hypothetical protein
MRGSISRILKELTSAAAMNRRATAPRNAATTSTILATRTRAPERACLPICGEPLYGSGATDGPPKGAGDPIGMPKARGKRQTFGTRLRTEQTLAWDISATTPFEVGGFTVLVSGTMM